jgi:hypothetical protein
MRLSLRMQGGGATHFSERFRSILKPKNANETRMHFLNALVFWVKYILFYFLFIIPSLLDESFSHKFKRSGGKL